MKTEMQPLDQAVDHVRGGPTGPVIVVYGDYQCPYSRVAFRELERVERRCEGAVRVAFRHFPLTDIHPHALAAAAAAEAAALQGQFWAMHALLSFIARTPSGTTTCGGMPTSSASMSRDSTATASGPPS